MKLEFLEIPSELFILMSFVECVVAIATWIILVNDFESIAPDIYE